MNDALLSEIRAHAERDFPRESCGLVVVRKGRERYIPCRNIADHNEHFVIHPEDQAAAEDAGEVVTVVHSHPNIPAIPSQADLVGCERSGVPWLIVNWPTGAAHEFFPTGYKAPLYGREFSHGVLDCYTFIQNYFSEVLNITLPDFDRPDEWWLKGHDLYMGGFASAGFVNAEGPLRQHDCFLMRCASPVPNHGAVYLGDGLIGHHQTGRLSSRDVYGGWLQKITVKHLRHKDLL